MLLPGHPGGVNSYKQYFWTDANSCDLGQQVDPYTKTILGTQRCGKKKKKKCYMDSRSSQIYLPKHIKNLYFRRNVFYFLSIVTLTFQLFCLVVLSSVCYVCFYQALGLSKWRNKINLIHLNRT